MAQPTWGLWSPEVPLLLPRPLEGTCGSHSLHPKQDYSVGLHLAPAHPSFKRRTNGYRPPTASSWSSNINSICTGTHEYLTQQNAVLLRSHAGLPYSHACRTGSLQRKSSPGMRAIRKRSAGYSAEPISSCLHCLLGLVKLVWAAYRAGERHQSACFFSVVSCVCRAAVIGLLSPSTHSDSQQTAYTLTEPPRRNRRVLPEGLLGSESLARKSSLSRHGAPQPARLPPYPSGQPGQTWGRRLPFTSCSPALPAESALLAPDRKSEARCHPTICTSKHIFEHMG